MNYHSIAVILLTAQLQCQAILYKYIETVEGSMRRLQGAELDIRIHKFLFRKFAAFPELANDDAQASRAWRLAQTIKYYRPEIKWSIETL